MLLLYLPYSKEYFYQTSEAGFLEIRMGWKRLRTDPVVVSIVFENYTLDLTLFPG